MTGLVGRLLGNRPRARNDPRLIIHSGLHKSGTTSLQLFLKSHFADPPPTAKKKKRGGRRQGRTVYPIDDRLSEPYDPGHNRLAHGVYGTEKSHGAEQALATLRDVIEARSGAEQILISAEDFAFASTDDLCALANGLAAWSPRIVLSISPHAAVYKGLFSTGVQWGFPGSFQEFLPSAKAHPALDPQVFQRFATAFRNAPLEIVVSLRSEDPEVFLRRFFDAIDLPWPATADRQPHFHRNTSLGLSEIEVMSFVNALFCRHHDLDRDRAPTSWEHYVQLRQTVVRLFKTDAWKDSFPHEALCIDDETRAFLCENGEEFLHSIRSLERDGRITVHGDLTQLNEGLE